MSWNKSVNILTNLQKKLYKSSFVSDFNLSKSFQQLILQSNSSKYLAIRHVLHFNVDKNVLNFSQRMDLIEFLKLNYKNWFPKTIKNSYFLDINGKNKVLSICAFSDSIWQTFVYFSLHPIHDSTFHPLNFGFRLNLNQYMVQKVLLLGLKKENVLNQKRLYYFNVEASILNFDILYLIKKLKIFKAIKLGIFRTLKKKFLLYYCEKDINKFSTLLCNVLLDGLLDVANIYQYGSHLLLIVNPMDNELALFNKISSFFHLSGINFSSKDYILLSLYKGFDFINWKFLKKGKFFISVPSNENYTFFLNRVKYIINNSNYGVAIKATKLFPIINDWYEYHRFSYMQDFNILIFSLKRRVLKVFIKESKQDYYSAKRLLDKCFFLLNNSYFFCVAQGNLKGSPKTSQLLNNYTRKKLSFPRHLTFCFGYFNFLCVHCGMNLLFF